MARGLPAQRRARGFCSTATIGCGRAGRTAVAPEGLAARLIPPAQRPKPSVHGGIAFLPHWPRIRLIIVGAGHVGQAVASLAAQADFDVWVVDDRHQYANRERFPTAQELLVGPIEEVLAHPGDHSPDVCPDRDSRARPRPGSAPSACPDAGGLRRIDRQPAQDPAHFREPARSRDLRGRTWSAWPRRSAWRSARSRCPRSRSASWPS